MRRLLFILIVVGLLAGGGYYFYDQQQQARQEPTFEILREATVELGTIQATVNATGSIEPEALVSLTFGLAGTIQQVNVVRGDLVEAGDVLAMLDTAELQLAVQQARDALQVQQLTLQQRLNSAPSPATLASAEADISAAEANVSVAEANVTAAQANVAGAQAAVLQAQAQRALLSAGPTAGTIAAANSQVAAAELAQKNAQEAYDSTLQCFDIPQPDGSTRQECPGLGRAEEQARANLANANAALDAARAQRADLDVGPREADLQAADAQIASARANVLATQGNVAAAEANVSAAQANVARAQAAYDRLLEGPTDDEIAILEAQVAAAETNLRLAELRLAQATIVAPMSGQVANVLINPGEQATPGAPAITVLDEGAFHIDVNVDEIDIDRIEVNQPVIITIDALPDTPIEGRVAEVAPTAVGGAGIVTYLVTINIDDPDMALRAGMSANASIIVEEIDAVLRVPNWAVRLDRESGQAFVNVLRADGSVREVTVTTGLRNEQFSEIRSGLEAGDRIVLTNERESFSLFGGGN